MRIAPLAAAFIVASSLPALAQETPRFDVSGGYSFLRDQEIEENLHGWVASVTWHLRPWLGITGEFGGNYKTIETLGTDLDFRVHTVMVGPRVSLGQSPNVTPFGHVLVGAARADGHILGESDSATEFAIQPGGGVDFWVASNVGFRIGADYRRIFADEAGNQFRFNAGVVVKAGQR